jgi:rhodanese-related sulfurtransferase
MSISVLDYFKAKQEATISPVGGQVMQNQVPDSLVIVDVRVGATPRRIPGAVVIPEPEIMDRMGELTKVKLLVLC